ncbi:MAG TPA: PilZ domain-containing protein, partial [Blastocatellia bacterium]
LAEPIKAQAPGANRRRADRIKLAIPALVLGHDRSGKWKEITKTVDVSRNGVAILISRRPRHGLVVQLRLPMPVRLRCHGHTEPGYKVYAIVRRVELPGDDGNRVVGMEFLGEQPPPGYLDKPWAPYRSQRWTGPDRRREPREIRSEQVFVEYLDNSENLIKREKAITEDISRSGVRLILRPNATDVDLVRVTNTDQTFSCLAAVRNRFLDEDGRERLCLKLIEKEWPL